MASTFKNQGLDVGHLDDSTGNMYTAQGWYIFSYSRIIYFK